MQQEQKKVRLTHRDKNANNQQWYKDQADLLDRDHSSLLGGFRGASSHMDSEYNRMKVNYDLYNNILNHDDFEYVCKPFGKNLGELPANMVNRDIISGKIKALLGMEMKRPFSWKVLATNSEATTRREQKEYEMIKEFVVSEIMAPIEQEIQQNAQEASQGKQMTPKEQDELQQKIAEETKARTPPEIHKYIEREYQDPSEVLTHQLLEYLLKKCKIKEKWSQGFKHLHISSKEIFYVGIVNEEPDVWNINSLRFNCDMSPDMEFIEDGEWATCEHRLTPSVVIKLFGNELTNKEIDKIYNDYSYYSDGINSPQFFDFKEPVNDFVDNQNTVRVLHCVWKSLRKLKFLTYLDENGEEQEIIVDEKYKLNLEGNDISIEEEWIPEVYETWKIGTDIYVNMRPLPGQFKDLDNIYKCKLPYYGALCDSTNSIPTGLIDRLKQYQYLYNIIMYRLELLMASDKGRKVLMNINAIPKSANIDIKKWQYFFESSPFMWYNQNEEGMEYQDVNSVAKQIDLSLASDIGKYVELAEYIKRQAGLSVGITEQVEGQIGPDDAVNNTRQSLIQSSHILEPYFELHNSVKKNVLEALIDAAKVAYSVNKPRKLSYIIDDVSKKVLELNPGLLEDNTFGIFVSNSTKAEEAKEIIRQLGHAALQNQRIELSDMLSLLRQEGLVEAEETLKAAESRRQEQEQMMQQAQQQAMAEESERQRKFQEDLHKMKLEEIIVAEQEKRKTAVIVQSIIGASYNPDQDKDKDGVNDFIEIAREGLDAEIKMSKDQLEKEKFAHQKQMDQIKATQGDKKLANERRKMSQKA